MQRQLADALEELAAFKRAQSGALPSSAGQLVHRRQMSYMPLA